MSDRRDFPCEIEAMFGGSGLDYSGLTRVQVRGQPLDAVEALRAILSRKGLGTTFAETFSVRCFDTGTGHVEVTAVLPRDAKGRHVRAAEAERLGRLILERFGVVVDPPEGA